MWWGLPLCVACKVSMYVSVAMCMGSSLGLGVGCGWSVIGRCFSLSCVNSAIYVGCRWQVPNGFLKMSKFFLVTQQRGNKCQVPQCIHHIDSLSYLGIVWLSGTSSRGSKVLRSRRNILSIMLFISCCQGVGFVTCSKDVKESLQGWLSVITKQVCDAVVVQVTNQAKVVLSIAGLVVFFDCHTEMSFIMAWM